MVHTEQGTIIEAKPMEQGISRAGKAWQRQAYVLETYEEYPRKIAFEVWGDNVHTCSMSVGEIVTAHLEAESREYKGRWYTQIKCIKIERIGMAGSSTSGAVLGANQAGQSPASDDLPF